MNLKELNISIPDDVIEKNISDCRRVIKSQLYCAQCPKDVDKCEFMGMVHNYSNPGKIFYISYCDLEIVRRKMQSIKVILKSMELPKNLDRYSFDLMKAEGMSQEQKACLNMAINEARQVVNRKKRGLVLYGGVGAGKTHISLGIVLESIKKGRTPLFITFPQFLNDIRDSFGKDKKEVPYLDVIKKADIIIIDDLGIENYNAWVYEQLFIIINLIERHEKQLVITTNYKASEFGDHLSNDKKDSAKGHRILSRIELICGVWFHLITNDYRRKK